MHIDLQIDDLQVDDLQVDDLQVDFKFRIIPSSRSTRITWMTTRTPATAKSP
ncbi:MAG: hypothetical protein WBM24_04000 [Candidatus Sulfotelmatobacter sp.]